ncbi:MAG: biotin transporter BioY [Bacillota bacterium]|nr:biotin transporter BioY [Bacillota bacterium]
MKISTKDLILCALFAAISCVLAQISFPLGPVPFTMLVMAIFLAGAILGAKRGFISQLVYVILGAIGAPVFSNLHGGIAVVLGPTGGFIIAFPFMALITGYFADKYKSKGYIVLGMLIGLIFCYAVGAAWLSYAAKMPFINALKVGVLPFIIFDIIKLIIAAVIGINIRTRLAKSGLA